MALISNIKENFSSPNIQSKPVQKRKWSEDIVAGQGYNESYHFEKVIEESEEEEIYLSESEEELINSHGYDTEENNYSSKQLQADFDKHHQSREFRETMSSLLEQMKNKYPERLRKL